MTTTVDCQSFFNLFKTRTADDEKPEDKNEDDSEMGDEDLLEEDFDTCNDIKDDLIPLALEYFLDLMEDDDDDEDFDDEGIEMDEKMMQ